MKVLLVKPNNLSDHIQPSLGLAYLAEGIRARHEVIILDCIKEDIGPAKFVQSILKDWHPDVVGIQCYTFDLGNVRKLLKATKEWNPEITTVVGGAHVSSDPIRAFDNLEENLDFAFAGEAETGFPKLINMLDDPAIEPDYFSIAGLVWKNGQELVANPLLRANYFTFLPLPGTESYHQLEENGEIENVDWDHYYIMSVAYTPPGITREELLAIKKKAFLKFYFRPRVLIRNLLSIKNFRHFKFLLKRFYNWIIVKDHPSTDFVVHPQPASDVPVFTTALK